ncbi:MAG: ABC transporter permease [Halodesulfurarchaeum sp.]
MATDQLDELTVLDRPASNIPRVWPGARVRRGLLGGLGFVLAWTLLAWSVPAYLLPTPVAVATAFVGELTAPAVYAVPVSGAQITLTALLVALLESLTHYLPGLVLGVGLGIPLGIAMGWFPRLEEICGPVVGLLRPIPPLAWMGLVIVWVGIGHAGAAVIVALGSFWITFYSALEGVENLPPEYTDVGRSLGIERDRVMLRKIVVPGIAPSVLTGIRTSIGRSWMLVVAAELFGAPGLGYEIIATAQGLSMDVSMAYMLALGLVYLSFDTGFQRARGVIGQ